MLSLTNFYSGLVAWSFLVHVASGRPQIESTTPASPQTTGPYAGRCAEVREETTTAITRPMWVPQTLITMINTYTFTTLSPTGPTPTSYPATITPTMIFSHTAEYQMTFSDGHSASSWATAAPVRYSYTTVKSAPDSTPCRTLD
ncbi:hypothetical protein QBC44DRAFT_370378 [Cladorrhinum sp. PSN332]|nr:hypothetical protein QBC44DRAFT_370378 [Cladorrhinum sp. PSN332]